MTRIINAFFDVHTKLRVPPPMPTNPVRKYKALTKPVLRGPLMVVNIYIYILEGLSHLISLTGFPAVGNP